MVGKKHTWEKNFLMVSKFSVSLQFLIEFNKTCDLSRKWTGNA
jgi:hypothetical protein